MLEIRNIVPSKIKNKDDENSNGFFFFEQFYLIIIYQNRYDQNQILGFVQYIWMCSINVSMKLNEIFSILITGFQLFHF